MASDAKISSQPLQEQNLNIFFLIMWIAVQLQTQTTADVLSPFF